MASRSTTLSKDAGPFDLFIAGLPRKYKWQDLKDLVRREASHGLHTEIFNQFDSTGRSQGEARVLRPEEAFKLYHFLTHIVIEGRHLQVHMFDLSNDGCQFIRCNCEPGELCPVRRQRDAAFAALSAAATAGARPSVAGLACYPPTVAPPVLHPRPMMPTNVAPMYPTMPMLPSHLDPLEVAMSRMYLDAHPDRMRGAAYASPTARPPPSSAGVPVYLPNSTGTLVNAARGVVKTEARGVFVSGLKYRATAEEVRAHFAAVGRVIRVDLHKDPKTKKSKGYATILYADVGTAQRAIDAFDGQDFMGMALKVRHDKETTAIAAAYPASSPRPGSVATTASSAALASAGRAKAPLIVNGTSAYAGRDRQDSPLASM